MVGQRYCVVNTGYYGIDFSHHIEHGNFPFPVSVTLQKPWQGNHAPTTASLVCAPPIAKAIRHWLEDSPGCKSPLMSAFSLQYSQCLPICLGCPLQQQIPDMTDRPGRVQAFRANADAIHDAPAAKHAERIIKIGQPLLLGIVPAIR